MSCQDLQPSAKLFQMMPPVLQAVRVNDLSERRPFFQFLGRSFHRRHDFAPRQNQFLAKTLSWRGPIRRNDFPVDALHLGARVFSCRRPSSFKFANLFSRGPLPVCQVRQQILGGPLRRHPDNTHLCFSERIKPRNQLFQNPQFLPCEHRRVHHRPTAGSGDDKLSMRSAMTLRLLHTRPFIWRNRIEVHRQRVLLRCRDPMIPPNN
jgi:hypothetical protein